MSTTQGSEDAAGWSTYWRGRAGQRAGAALIGAGVETDRDLATFWQRELATRPKDGPLLDLACGAGSVLNHAAELGFTHLLAADVSPDAIAEVTRTHPGVTGYVASASAVPLEAGACQTVVSQFGFEYAGATETAREIARLLAPGGQFIAIAHRKNSPIATEVKDQKTGCDTLLASGFHEAARTYVRALFAQDTGAATTAEAKLAEIARHVADLAQAGNGSASHLLQGTNQLLNRRSAYDVSDITGWLDGMEAETRAHRVRMDSMLNAALTEDQAREVVGVITGGSPGTVATFTFEGDTEPAAWHLAAQTPAP